MTMEALGAMGLFFVAIVALLALWVCLIPSWIGFAREHRHRWPLFILNLLMGWSGIVWIACLVWAVWPKEKK